MNQRPLRIGWDNSLARRSRTGTGVYAAQLIRELSALPDVQLEVLNGWDLAEGTPGIVARATRGLARLAWSHWYLPRIIRKRRFDVLHGPAFVVPSPCPCPSVVTVHDVSFRLFPEYFERRWLLYLTSMLPKMLRSVSAVITVSHQAKKDLLRFYDIPSEKVYVVYNGIDHARFNPGAKLEPEWAAAMGLRSGYVLQVGEISDRKNICTLLRAIHRLRSLGTWGERQLALAGPETPGMTGAKEVHETIRRLDLSDIVVVLGRIDHERVPGLYSSASLLVMPSLYEGFGLPVVESMAVGTPVVASNVSSLPEVAGDAAILVPPTDDRALAEAIDQVLNKPGLAAELRAKGLVQAKQFDWRRAAKETLEVYRSMAG
jgi:glycosyltransferase involved in cell wall biosynthesis